MILVLAGLTLAAAALHDIAARTIPNRLSLGIAGLGLLARVLADEALAGLLAGCLVFLLACFAWRCRVMGGGDVKLLAACALLPPPAAVPGLVLAVALAGGALALTYLALQPLLPAPALARPGALPARALRAEAWRIRRRGPLPYGVAIALGTFFTLLG
ncbi:prepilin peptidase [Dankookia sp. GCM10030260]|uniref:prepilin peptidase n=1 Tax=Dankookia sp. GCM10030260 TaxID=3273390 RepID=UPI003608BD44